MAALLKQYGRLSRTLFKVFILCLLVPESSFFFTVAIMQNNNLIAVSVAYKQFSPCNPFGFSDIPMLTLPSNLESKNYGECNFN